MLILLQSFETGLYLDTIGGWTNTVVRARNFHDTKEAAAFKFHRRLANVFVVVQPEPAPPINLYRLHDGTIMRAQEPAKPVGCRGNAIPAKGRSAQGKSTIAKNQIGSNLQPCNVRT